MIAAFKILILLIINLKFWKLILFEFKLLKIKKNRICVFFKIPKNDKYTFLNSSNIQFPKLYKYANQHQFLIYPLILSVWPSGVLLKSFYCFLLVPSLLDFSKKYLTMVFSPARPPMNLVYLWRSLKPSMGFSLFNFSVVIGRTSIFLWYSNS